MNEKIKALTGVGLGGLFVLFAMHGKAFLDALLGFPTLIRAYSSVLPLGVWSSVLALVVAMGAWGFALHWLPRTKQGKAPHLAAETIALCVAVAVTVGQQWAGKPGDLLLALWMGVAAGFLAPYLGKCIAKVAA